MSTLKKITKRSEMGVLIPLLLLWIITGCFNKNFFSSMSMFSLLRSISVTLLGSIGATFVFSCGMMDLSVGAVYGLAGMVSGLLMVHHGVSPVVAMLAAFLVAALFGGQTAMLSRVVYTLVGVAAVWCISLLFRDHRAE